jgi:hypothetical protein
MAGGRGSYILTKLSCPDISIFIPGGYIFYQYNYTVIVSVAYCVLMATST